MTTIVKSPGRQFVSQLHFYMTMKVLER